eukprot:gene4012-4558_t
MILQTSKPPSNISHKQYRTDLQRSMTVAQEISSQKAKKRKSDDIHKKNIKALSHELQIGDRVLIRNLGDRGGPVTKCNGI